MLIDTRSAFAPQNRLTENQSILLDFLRGAASLVVLVGHGLAFTGFQHFGVQTSGVVVFFVLSGFLITYTCMVKQNYRFGEFMIDRFARIYTSLVPALILVLVFNESIGRDDGETVGRFLGNLFMLEFNPALTWFYDIPRIERSGGNAPLWSIPLEWWLYAMFGILFLRGGTLLKLALAPVALATFVYSTGMATTGLSWLMGAAFAVALLRTPPPQGWTIPAGLLVVAIIVMATKLLSPGMAHKIVWTDPNIMTAIALGIAAIVLLAGQFEGVIGGRTKWVVEKVALISFPLYLIHYPIQWAIRDHLGKNALAFVAVVLIPLAVAALFAWCFERHHKDVRRWLKAKIL